MFSKDDYRYVFVDAEYTGEHARTTLVSLALVGEDGESIHISFSDFDRRQVTPWLEENVLAHLDPAVAVPRDTGWRQIADWLDGYRCGKRVSLVSVGKTHDIVLLFELWHAAFPERPFFHNLHCLPDYLNHAAHYDLPTVFFMCGLDPGQPREAFLGNATPPGRRHDALYDAQVVRLCFQKCLSMRPVR